MKMMYREDRLVISVWWMVGSPGNVDSCVIRVMIDLKAPQPGSVLPWQASLLRQHKLVGIVY